MAGSRVMKLTPKDREVLALRELDYPLERALVHFRAAAERLGLGTEMGALFTHSRSRLRKGRRPRHPALGRPPPSLPCL
jgi:hypothetical protein